jgi:nucleoside triphosphate diphosphatase
MGADQNEPQAAAEITRLLHIMAKLRDTQTGCPWDVAQSFETIAPYTIEEAYEVADAIARKAWGELPSELGDLLLQVVFHAQIAREADMFTFADVARAIGDKMLARHPHVFGGESREKTPAQQTLDWERQKAAERGADARVLDGVALGLPALTRAVKLQNRAARVGFDWPSTTEVLDKLREEITELRDAEARLGPDEMADEFGDLLFVMANLARHLNIDPEAALRSTNAKFTRRFGRIEDWLREAGKTPAQSNLAEMDALWSRAKKEERA